MRLAPTLVAAMIVLLALPALAAAPPGDPKAAAFERYKEGGQAMKDKRYEDAAQAFSEAFTLDPAPRLLFNVARAYEELGAQHRASNALKDARHALKTARAKFVEFMAHEDAPADLRVEAGEKIVSVGAELAAVETSLADARAQAAIEEARKNQPPPAEDSSALGTVGLVTLITGGVLLGAGVGLYVHAEGQRADVNDAATDSDGAVTAITQRRARELQDSANTNATLGVVGITVGAVAAAAGTLMMVLGADDGPTTSSHTTISGGPTDRGWMVTAQGHF